MKQINFNEVQIQSRIVLSQIKSFAETTETFIFVYIYQLISRVKDFGSTIFHISIYLDTSAFT
jgi:hypothetical protein